MSTILLDMTRIHIPVLAGELIGSLFEEGGPTRPARRAPAGCDPRPPAGAGRDRLHLRRRRPRAPGRPAPGRERDAGRDRPRPRSPRSASRSWPRRCRARCASSAAATPRRWSCSRRRDCARTSRTSTSACPRCRWTRASAASPTPTTRRWTCAWTPSRSSTRARSSPPGISAGWRECCASSARSATPARSPARSCAAANGGADRDHAGAGGDRQLGDPRPRALRRRAPRQAGLPGAADRRQRRARPARPRAAARVGAAARGGRARRHLLPLARGPAREALHGRARAGLHLPAGPAGVRLRARARRRRCSRAARSPPSAGELAHNPRAASARLRAARKLTDGPWGHRRRGVTPPPVAAAAAAPRGVGPAPRPPQRIDAPATRRARSPGESQRPSRPAGMRPVERSATRARMHARGGAVALPARAGWRSAHWRRSQASPEPLARPADPADAHGSRVVAFALIGIVAMQLWVVKLGVGIGRALEHAELLQRENSALAIEDSSLSSGERVEQLALAKGMELAPPGALHFDTPRGSLDARLAAAALAKPVPAPAGRPRECHYDHSPARPPARKRARPPVRKLARARPPVRKRACGAATGAEAASAGGNRAKRSDRSPGRHLGSTGAPAATAPAAETPASAAAETQASSAAAPTATGGSSEAAGTPRGRGRRNGWAQICPGGLAARWRACRSRIGVLFAVFFAAAGGRGGTHAVSRGAAQRGAAQGGAHAAGDGRRPCRRSGGRSPIAMERCWRSPNLRDDISATPYLVKDPLGAAERLAPLLGRSQATVLRDLSERSGFVYLARALPAARAQAVLALNIPGVAGTPTMRRVYPRGTLAAQVLGMMGESGGLSGLEYADNAILQRASGRAAGGERRARPVDLDRRCAPRGARSAIEADAGREHPAAHRSVC